MAGQLIQVLLVEDNPGDVRLLQEFLAEVTTTTEIELTPVADLASARQILATQNFDVILLDLSLPDSQGLETFIAIHHQAPTIPAIVLTGTNDETLALKAVQEGAQDYLVKGQIGGELLVRAMRYAIERQRAESDRLQSQATIREQAALLDVATDAIFVQDLDGQILFWNKGAERIYGWQAAAACGQNASELLYEPPAPQLSAIHQMLAIKGEWQGELEQVTQEGRKIIVESRWTLVSDRAKPPSILVVNTDITEKKKLETQFLRAQRLESIGTLASGIAHDLNNVLTPILMSVQLLQLKYPNQQDRQLLQTVEATAKRGASLIKQVLSFARGLEGDCHHLQVRHLIREIQQIVAETFPKSIELVVDCAANLWTICGDPTQLHQVLMNLVVNARDAMPDGGTIKITAENLEIDAHYAQMHIDARVGAYIVIAIADTGMGMPPTVLERIFEPFFTTKQVGKGTGLGLSTALGIVKSHAGFINVYSEVGRGTQFKIYLPAVEGTETFPASDSEFLIGNGEFILVVDDETAIREITKSSLEAYNYRVLTASDGIEALAIYAQHQLEISVVLLDMMMPIMGGIATIRALQKMNPQVKIIAISGLASQDKTSEVANLGVNTFLSKPCTAKELLQAIKSVGSE